MIVGLSDFRPGEPAGTPMRFPMNKNISAELNAIQSGSFYLRSAPRLPDRRCNRRSGRRVFGNGSIDQTEIGRTSSGPSAKAFEFNARISRGVVP